LQRSLRAGYQLSQARLTGDGFWFPATPSLLRLGVTVIPQGELVLPGSGYWFAYRLPWFAAFRRGAGQVGPVIVWGPADRATGEPRRVTRSGAIRRFPYIRLEPPVVPAGTAAVRIGLKGPLACPENPGPG